MILHMSFLFVFLIKTLGRPHRIARTHATPLSQSWRFITPNQYKRNITLFFFSKNVRMQVVILIENLPLAS